jgi:hypothetical protein
VQAQAQIKRTLSQPGGIVQIRDLLDVHPGLLRTHLADEVCQRFGFLDARGENQRSTTLKALRDLEKEGHFQLPAASPRKNTKPSPRRLSEAVPAPRGVPGSVEAVEGLHLVLVTTEGQRRIWNELMIREHPREAGPLVGRQLRYLVASKHGWLGGLGFGSAALKLRDRDTWIGWDSETRRTQLHRVVNLNRFLIRTSFSCQNLASRVLGLCLKRLSEDFEGRYGFRPWLVETFVDRQQFRGTCFRAANWERIGQTQGRGRQDRKGARPESIKEIHVYSLEPSFRGRMDLPPGSGRIELPPDSDIESDQWAELEFGGASLGDRRLGQRLVEAATAIAEQPGRSFSEIAGGDWAAVKGYYRFIDKPDDSAVTMENILHPHRERTVQRMKGHQTVLCIQDGTDLDFSSLTECTGLGIIGTNQTGAKTAGLHLHTTLATTTAGLPLGVLRSQCVAPVARSKADKRRRESIPIEEKKTFGWVEALRDCQELAPALPDTRLVNVMDREADFFELFDAQRQNPGVDVLVRARHDRKTTTGENLFDLVTQGPIEGELDVEVHRQSARPKKSKQKAREKRAPRVANLSLRYRRVELKPSRHLPDHEPLSLWVIEALEESPPEGVKPLHWILLTTIEIDSVEKAKECIRWYCARWRIEDWHRVLKSGCRIERFAHKTVDRLRRAIAINLVVAWRVMVMTLLRREEPELPADVVLSELEIEVINAFAEKARHLKPATHLGDTVQLVARLGGYLARSNDPPPGHQMMWRGFVKLQAMCEGYALLRDG